MSREVRRVPLDFNWPLRKVWGGYITPENLRLPACPNCESGYSEGAQNLHDLWYGYIPFNPESTGSTPLRADTPAVRAFAERNVQRSPEYYGTSESAVVREAQRLADLWNSCWSHHLSQDDVNALVEDGRLMDFTHTCRKGEGWKKIEPPVIPTAAEVNEWSIRGFGHDSINCWVVISARCKREGIEERCATCGGHATVEAYPGQRAEAEAWEWTQPPEGSGFQLWETVSEGSPISPVFNSAEGLAAWIAGPDSGRDWMPQEAAAKFIKAGWAPSFVGTPETGLVRGPEYVGCHAGDGDE